MDPTKNAQGVVEFLTDHQTGILACAAIMVLVVPFEYPFVVLTSMQMRRIEGGWGLLSMVQLTTGVVAPIGFFFPIAILAAAAYRPESHSPDVLHAMSDIYWLRAGRPRPACIRPPGLVDRLRGARRRPRQAGAPALVRLSSTWCSACSSYRVCR
ncbi:hypothetical protein ACRAWF_16760 [Streptomyces sp. L7]